jgi:hypothetical protein
VYVSPELFSTETAQLFTWSWIVPMVPSCGSPYAPTT